MAFAHIPEQGRGRFPFAQQIGTTGRAQYSGASIAEGPRKGERNKIRFPNQTSNGDLYTSSDDDNCCTVDPPECC
jgi:hypothetical protein